jgi:hypothetical protein
VVDQAGALRRIASAFSNEDVSIDTAGTDARPGWTLKRKKVGDRRRNARGETHH